MSPPCSRSPSPNTRFPRVSGDEPQDGTITIDANSFSPRERG